MFGHLPELVIILALGLIIFGPEKLPEVAANAGKMVRELREMMDTALNPQDQDVPDDFSSYYYESLERHGEEEIPMPEMSGPAEAWPGVAGPEAYEMAAPEVDDSEYDEADVDLDEHEVPPAPPSPAR